MTIGIFTKMKLVSGLNLMFLKKAEKNGLLIKVLAFDLEEIQAVFVPRGMTTEIFRDR